MIHGAAPLTKLNVVPFVSVDNMMKLVHAIGVERFLVELAGFIEDDFRRWESFDKTPRVASHSAEGVIELMPTSDGAVYGFKYVNGHPKNTARRPPDGDRFRRARRCRDRLSRAADRDDDPDRAAHRRDFGAGRQISGAARRARTMAMIGNGAQAEFQALAFKALLGVDRLRLYDIDRGRQREMRAQSRGPRLRHRSFAARSRRR